MCLCEDKVLELYQAWMEDTPKENPALRHGGTGRWEESELLKLSRAGDFRRAGPASFHFFSDPNPTIGTALLKKVKKIVMLSDREWTMSGG